MFVGFLYSKVTPHPIPLLSVLFRRKPLCTSHSTRVGTYTPSHSEYYKIFKIHLHGRFTFSSINYSIISVWDHRFYTLSYNTRLFIVTQNFPDFDLWKLLPLVTMPFNIPHKYEVGFIFLFVSSTDAPGSFTHFLLTPKVSHSLRALIPFMGEWF